VIEQLAAGAARPIPFQPSDAPFWDDPHISAQLLALHFDDSVEAASRSSATIGATVERLMTLVDPGARVLDLGCGPGRYAELLAASGCVVTGVDSSHRSIAHARTRAADLGLDIDYRLGDFLALDDVASFDLVLQSFGELNTLDDPVRDSLLAAIHRALVPGGVLVFDSSTPAFRSRLRRPATWSVETTGFWRASPHLVLEAGHSYPDDVWCDQYVVVDDRVTAYRMWFHDYTPDTLAPVLEHAGFTVAHLWEGLAGGSYAGGDWIGVVARRVGP
jgi:SAM-dependent methyltransferase